jgi:hypothetical protein
MCALISSQYVLGIEILITFNKKKKKKKKKRHLGSGQKLITSANRRK